jgi:hypothetical protein
MSDDPHETQRRAGLIRNKREARMTLYDAAIEAAFRKFKNNIACDDTFEEMCEWITKWLRRRKQRALVSFGRTATGAVKFQITDEARFDAR